MRAITLFRAMAWFGVVIVFWSLNVRWGQELGTGKGPPGQYERYVVGAGLMAFVAAFALSISGRKNVPPAWWARGLAGGCALVMLLIAWSLFDKASDLHLTFLQGAGYAWLLSGSGMIVGAAVGSLGLKSGETGAKRSADKEKRRKRR